MARLPYVDAEQAAPEVRELYRKMAGNGARIANIYRMMAHSPAAFRPFLKFGQGLLLRAELDPKLRELSILRVATLTGSQYEWQQHSVIARQVGASEAEIAAVATPEDSAVFDDRERTMFRYVDETTRNVSVSDETFESLRRHFGDTELVELTLTIGFYNMVARFLVPLQVDLEEDAISGQDLLGSTWRPRATAG